MAVDRAILTILFALAVRAAADPVVVVGRRFSLFIEPYHGTVRAAGKNEYGQLGSNDTMDQVVPINVPILGGSGHVVSGAAGAFHSLLLTDEGEVYAAGRNNHGQLGMGNNMDSFSFVKVPMPQGVQATAVAAGYAHSLVLTQDKEVYAFGHNQYGQLGDGSLESRSEPTLITVLQTDAEMACSNGTKVRGVAAGYDFSYFVLADTKFGEECDGQVFAAGMGLGGQLGTGMREAENPVPVQVTVGSVETASAGASHGLFLLKTGLIAMTGANFDGQLGSATTAFVAMPTVMFPDAAAAAGVFAGGDSSCYTGASDRSVMAMGSNRRGQLGLGGNLTVMEPREVEALGAVLGASLGESHSLFVRVTAISSQVYAAGSNANGELGDGTQESTNVPVESVPRVTTQTATDTTTSIITATETSTMTMPPTVTMTQSEGVLTSTVTDTETRGAEAAPLTPTDRLMVAAVPASIMTVLLGAWGLSSMRERARISAEERGTELSSQTV